MIRSICRFAALALAFASASACTGGPALDGTGGGGNGSDGDPPATETCENYAGTWAMIGGCPNMNCELTQTGCSIVITCGRRMTVSGNLSGTSGWVSGSLGEEE